MSKKMSKKFKGDERKMVASATMDEDRKSGKKKRGRRKRGYKK